MPGSLGDGAGAPPPQPPQQQQQHADEESACVHTIVQCLSLSLLALQGDENAEEHQLSLHETREFLNLILSLVDSDPSPHRLRTLLLDSRTTPVHILLAYASVDTESLTPSYRHRDTYTSVGFDNIKVQCIRTLTTIISTCCGCGAAEGGGGGEGDALKAPLFQLLTSSGAVDLLLRFLSNGAEQEGLRTAAAECMFVFLSKVDEAKEAVVRLRAVQFFFDVLWKEQSMMVRNYLCAMLRVVAQCYSEQLLDPAIFERGVALLQHEASKHVAIMLLDVFTKVLDDYDTFYLQRIHPLPKLLSSLCRLCEAILHRNVQPDVVQGVTSLMGAIFRIEGADRERTGFIDLTLSTGCWKALAGLHAPEQQQGEAWAADVVESAVLKTATLRMLIENCTTRETVAALVEAVSGFFPAVSQMLNAPMDEGCPLRLRQEVGVAFVIWLAKAPQARRFVKGMLHQYPSWGSGLRDRLSEILSGMDPVVFEKIHIVDCHLTYLNDPASEPDIDYTNMAAVYAAVGRMVKQQEQGGPGAAHDCLSPATENRAAAFARSDARQGLKLAQRKQRLTSALLNYAVTDTFTDGVPTLSLSPPPQQQQQQPQPQQQQEQRQQSAALAELNHYQQQQHRGPQPHPQPQPCEEVHISRVEDHEQMSPKSDYAASLPRAHTAAAASPSHTRTLVGSGGGGGGGGVSVGFAPGSGGGAHLEQPPHHSPPHHPRRPAAGLDLAPPLQPQQSPPPAAAAAPAFPLSALPKPSFLYDNDEPVYRMPEPSVFRAGGGGGGDGERRASTHSASGGWQEPQEDADVLDGRPAWPPWPPQGGSSAAAAAAARGATAAAVVDEMMGGGGGGGWRQQQQQQQQQQPSGGQHNHSHHHSQHPVAPPHDAGPTRLSHYAAALRAVPPVRGRSGSGSGS
eukprot:Rhum_TRINITY_DN14340_c9_g1::Rhum_TRINITY_DN14340_c9_g1_i1::g.83573::m.83573